MNKKLSIVTAPSPILYEKARSVKSFDNELKKIVEEMIPVMRKADGMGLAAPQIGKSLKIAIIEFTPKDEEKKEYIPIPLTVLINPKIINTSRSQNIAEEGCLSLPEINLDVPRFDSITVLYQDVSGSRHRMKAEGIAARMIQHELDHLDGILITDRCDKTFNKFEMVNDKQ